MHFRVGVVALQASPHIASLYANDGIFAGRIVWLSSEDLYSNEPFLKQVAFAADLLIDNVLEELLASTAGTEVPAGYDPAQFFSNEIWGNRILLQAGRRVVAWIIEYRFCEHAGIIRRRTYGSETSLDQ